MLIQLPVDMKFIEKKEQTKATSNEMWIVLDDNTACLGYMLTCMPQFIHIVNF